MSKFIFIFLSLVFIKLIESLIILFNSFFLKIGLGILAKSENSFTSFSISLICLLIVLIFSKNEDEPVSQYEWLKVFVLFVLVFTYGLIIKTVGFFLSTNLFLITAYYYLGVRNFKLIFFCSVPVVAGLQFLLHELLDVYIRDPLLQSIGIIS